MAGRQSPDGPRMRVVGETSADAGAVHERGDSDAAKVIRRTDAGQLEELWRAERAGAHDDLPVGVGLPNALSGAIFDPDGTPTADDHPIDRRLRNDGQVG